MASLDGQATPEAVGLVVVEDEHRPTVVAGQAVVGEVTDLLGTPAGVDRKLDGTAHLRRRDLPEVRAQLAHDLRRQGPSRFGRLGRVGDVFTLDGEVLTQAGGELSRAGEAHGPDPGEHRPHRPHLPRRPEPGIAADAPGRLQVGEPVQERLHGRATERRRSLASIGHGPKRLRQQRHAVHVVAHGEATAGAPPRPDPAPGQVIGRPPLGRFPEPVLADRRKRDRARVSEQCQVPFVADDLGLGGGQGPAGMGLQ